MLTFARTAVPPGGEGFLAVGQLMSGFVAWVTIAIGLFTLIVGGVMLSVSIARGETPRWGFMILGVVMTGGGFGLRLLLAGEEQAPPDGPTLSPSPTSTPTPTPSLAAPREPADLTWLLVAGGVVALLLLAALFIWVVIIVTTRTRRSLRSSREEAAAKRAARDRVANAWQSFHNQHDELLRKILHAETDWDALFFTPALTDPNVPTTYAMLRAMRDANTLRDVSPAPLDADPTVDLTQLPYPAAVARFATAWDAAEHYARKVGQKNIPHAERKIIRQIRTLLDIAENTAASQTERDLAYRRVQGLLEQIQSIQIPEKAFARLEQQQRLMITTGNGS